MGHMLKNTVFRSGSHALGVPVGTSSIGPDSPVNGQTRYNTTTGRLEFYANITGTPSWNAVAREGNVYIARDNFTGNGVATQFWPLSTNFTSGQEQQVLVHAGTVYQIPVTNYTFDGTGNILFSSAPNNGAAITIISGFASTKANIA
jgi:hypothetical protein